MLPATQRVDGWSVGGSRAHSVLDDVAADVVVVVVVVVVVADVIVVVVVVDIICRKRFDVWY